MADLTKCSGHGCPLKEDCYRFTVESSEWQSWFSEIPFTTENGRVDCEYYWKDYWGRPLRKPVDTQSGIKE